MLTIRELTAELGLDVIAGEAGLDSAVRWVHISELPDPTPWLSGGELLLTTGMRVRGEGESRRLVRCLADHGVAGLGVGLGTGIGLEEVPAEMIAEADARAFPLFAVPRSMPFIAITERAATHLVSEAYATLQRAIAAHDELQGVVLAEQGLDGVARSLAQLLEGGVMVLDAHGKLLARHGLAGERAEALARVAARRRPGSPDGSSLVLPVSRRAGDAPEAWLAAAKEEGPLEEFDRLLLHQAVTIVALELLRRRVAADTERRLAGDVLASILSRELEGPELQRRLEPFGLHDRLGVVVLSPPPELKDAVERVLPAILRAEAGGGLAAPAGRLSCALVPVPEGADHERELFALAERLRRALSEEVEQPLPAGAGRPVALADAQRAFHEARCALDAGALAPDAAGPAGVATYRDLGSFQLLLSLQDDEALRLFCDSILGPVEEGDSAYAEELLRSLEVFVECNGQWEKAARRLYCHRHTLRYRIRRVEELTGRSLESARDRIDFWLALRGRELLR